MLQKRNDLEIIELLRKEQAHIRLIGKRLNLIPSTVLRTVKRLEDEKVVDFKVQGKNKTYFLKDTPESRIYLLMSEHYKLLKCLENQKLRRIFKQLKDKTCGELIVLFGSYAKGSAKKDSDVDIFVETKNRSVRAELNAISDELSIKIGELNKNDLLSKEIIKDHIVIQNVEIFQSFSDKNIHNC